MHFVASNPGIFFGCQCRRAKVLDDFGGSGEGKFLPEVKIK
jgi:hypothetical protein